LAKRAIYASAEIVSSLSKWYYPNCWSCQLCFRGTAVWSHDWYDLSKFY